jgi:hypothetical protein
MQQINLHKICFFKLLQRAADLALKPLLLNLTFMRKVNSTSYAKSSASYANIEHEVASVTGNESFGSDVQR